MTTLEEFITRRIPAHNLTLKASTTRYAMRVKGVKEVQAGAAAIKQILQTVVANGGEMVSATITDAPILDIDINQWKSADCYLLSQIRSRIEKEPAFANAQIFPYKLPDGSLGAIVQYWSSPTQTVVQIETASTISTSFDVEKSGDVKVGFFEKTYSLFRAGVSDYAKIDYGTPTEFYSACGLNVSYLMSRTVSACTASINAGNSLNFGTAGAVGNDPNGNPWITYHDYAVILRGGVLYAVNPWNGTVLIPLTDDILAEPWITGVGVGAPVKPPRLVAPPPLVAPPATPTSNIQVTAMAILNYTSMDLTKATLTAPERLENNGMPDIGWQDQNAGDLSKIPFTVPAAGNYLIRIPFACPASDAGGTITVAGKSFLFAAPNTGSYSVYAFVDVVVPNVPAGANELDITKNAGPQFNTGTPQFAQIV